MPSGARKACCEVDLVDASMPEHAPDMDETLVIGVSAAIGLLKEVENDGTSTELHLLERRSRCPWVRGNENRRASPMFTMILPRILGTD